MATVVRTEGAPSWVPNVVVLPASPVGTQIAGIRPGRQTIVINNTGANPVVVNNAAQPSTPGFTIGAGGVLSIDTTGEVYAFSAAGSTVQTIETYGVPVAKRTPMPSYVSAIKE